MQEKNRFVGGASGREVDPELLQESLFNILTKTAQSGVAGLGTAATLQQRRANRLNEAAKAMSAKLGAEHPDVLAVQAMAASAGNLKVKIGEETKRAKKFPKLRPHEWVVFGTIRDQAGLPAGGLTVRVFDLDRKYDDLLGETETDDHGDFSIVYHERDFKESNENLPELYVMVSDAKGVLLYTSRENIRFNAGQAEYFLIRIGGPEKPASKTAARTAAKTTTRSKKG